jgi:YteA family regulatory protein
MLTNEQLQTFRQRLKKEKREIQERLEKNNHLNLVDGHLHESVGELSSYDNHPADEGTELYEREKDIALHDHLENELYDIDKALEAIEKGTYGKCQKCGTDIPLERLEALPTTRYCMEHSPNQVVSQTRPIEEEILKPPFGQFEYDDEDVEAFDAEDSWQTVAKWGTSNSPSDFVVAPDSYNEMYEEADDKDGYAEDFENFAGTDIYGKNVTVYPSDLHEEYEEILDEEGIMTTFGDLKPYEVDPYTEEDNDENPDEK